MVYTPPRFLGHQSGVAPRLDIPYFGEFVLIHGAVRIDIPGVFIFVLFARMGAKAFLALCVKECAQSRKTFGLQLFLQLYDARFGSLLVIVFGIGFAVAFEPPTLIQMEQGAPDLVGLQFFH